jgi:hypothetical protein
VAGCPKNVESHPFSRSRSTFCGPSEKNVERAVVIAARSTFSGSVGNSSDGVVGYKQLSALGFTRNEIDQDACTNRLIRVHRGVYAVGHEALSDRGRMIAGLPRRW